VRRGRRLQNAHASTPRTILYYVSALHQLLCAATHLILTLATQRSPWENAFCVRRKKVTYIQTTKMLLGFHLRSGLEKTQVLLKKPAGRLNAGFFTGFSGKTGFSLKMSIFGGQYQ
jgi:uncharacterized protein (DUF849 family)